MKIDMKVRQMKTGETLVATLDSFEDAVTWLGQRPDFTEVLGLLSEDLSPRQREAMRDAMRPYTAEEQAFQAELRAEDDRRMAERMQQEQAEWERRSREEMERQLQADPNRVKAIRWHRDEGYSSGDANDPREITEAAKQAVAAWVAERNSWVEDRGQEVIEAHVEVYLGETPSGSEDERVVGGQFFPVSKAKPTAKA
ncbi:MAG: hypothetical protein H6712_31165 [Myxococcales bacterium]|nr:hypothetical protein [Myxococcales bacterium]MCB9718352.1 hypothetical protein [Myxococcales bacterium]